MKAPRKAVLVKPAPGPKNEINVTPLVDVVLVLLIIFMVVTPLAEKDLAVRIPALEKVETTLDVPPDQIVVHVAASGSFAINGRDTAPNDYIATLHQRLLPRALIDRVVFVSADDEAPYKKLVAALDGAHSAGAETLGMTPDIGELAASTAPP